ncbi:MAG TPA: glycosyltransferase family 2 protein [Planctomycetota bacterium]|nr:glycosyltransferase family 2 protein [Planctomycetota bacterium]
MTNSTAARGISDRLRVVAVLPAYNLEGSIAGIVERTLKQVDAVVVAADGSRDGTAAAARAAGAVVPEPEAVRGKGYALIKGIEATKALGADVIVVMDSDGQHLPEEIGVVVAPLLEGRGDMVVGSRMLGTLRTSTINKFGNFGLKLISFAVTGRWLTDTESGFRAFRAEKLWSLPLSSRGYEIESELLLRALHAGFRVTEVPIHVPFAVPGVTVWDGIKVGWYKLRVGLGLRLGAGNTREVA